jgi:iron complex outermembrane receptor protein
MKIQTGVTSLIALVVAGLFPAVAHAQEAKPEATGIEDIVVTARKREENLQKVPISVTALSAIALKNQSVQTVKDIQYQTPSLTINPTNSDRNNLSVTIRGQNVSDTLLSVDPAIGIYIDGVNYAKTLGTELAVLTDVTRVEVLKGPQGTLFGRNTTGGALSVTTKLPNGNFEGEATLRTDEFSRIGGSAVLNVPLDGDNLALRLVGSYDHRNSFGQNTALGNGIGGDLDGGGIRGTLLWKASSAVEVILRGDYAKTSTTPQAWKSRDLVIGAPGALSAMAEVLAEMPAGTTPAQARDAYISGSNSGKFWNTSNDVTGLHSLVKSYGGSATINIDLSDSAKFKSITSFRSMSRDTLMDQDGSSFHILKVNGITSQKLWQEEAQFSGKALNDRLDWIIGGFYSRETGNDGTLAWALEKINPTVSVTVGDVINKSAAAFGQITYRVTDELSLTGGLRYTEDSKDLVSRNHTENLSGVVIACAVPGLTVATCLDGQTYSGKFHNLAYTAVIDYKVTPDVLVYAKTSTGYRSGGFNLRGTANPATRVPFLPEHVTDYEIGFKGDFLDHRVRINLAGYRSSYNDIQRSILIPIPTSPFTTTVTLNAASARIWGLEAELTVKPTDALTLRASGAITDAKYLVFKDQVGGDFSGLKFGATPKYTYTLSAGYNVPIASGPLHLQVDWAWQDTIYYFPTSLYNGLTKTPDLRGQDAYGLLNMRISKTFENPRLDVAFFVRNVLNRKYYSVGLDTSTSLGFNSGVPGDPRVIGAEATIKF